jgi:hypothetical protein
MNDKFGHLKTLQVLIIGHELDPDPEKNNTQQKM